MSVPADSAPAAGDPSGEPVDEPARFNPVADRLSQALQAYFDALLTEVTGPLQQAEADARAAHGRVVADQGRDRSDASNDATESLAAWQVAAYRRQAADTAVLPLLATLQRWDGLNRVRQHREILERQLGDVVNVLPSLLPATATAAPDGPSRAMPPTVPFWRRWLAGSAAATLEPLGSGARRRAVAGYVQDIVLPAVDRATDEFLAATAGRQAAVQKALAEWTGAVLAHEQGLRDGCDDGPDGLLPAVSPSEEPAGTRKADPAATIAGALDEQLGSSADAVAVLPASAQSCLEAVSTDAIDDVLRGNGRAGKDLPSRDRRSSPAVSVRPAERWRGWFERSANRSRIVTEILRLRAVTEALRRDFVADMYAGRVAPLEQSLEQGVAALDDILTDSEAVFDEASRDNRYSLYRSLQRNRDEARRVVDDRLLNTLQRGLDRRDIETRFDRGIEQLRRALDASPSSLRVPSGGERPDPVSAGRTVNLKWAVQQGFNERYFATTDSTVGAFRQVLESAAAQLSEIITIVNFNQGAAVEELRDGLRRLSASADAWDIARDSARSLSANGLKRASEAMAGQRGRAKEALAETAQRLYQLETDAWRRILGCFNVARGKQESSASQSRITLVNAAQAAGERMQSAARHARSSVVTALRNGWRRLGALIHLGRSAVTGATPAEGASQQTLEALARVDDTIAELPVVYRRLFSFYAVTDASLLKGRHRDLRIVARHLALRGRGLTDALLLTGDHGSGLTSFLNVLRTTVLRDTSTTILSLYSRVDSEQELARRLADALGLTVDTESDDIALEDLEEPILARTESDTVEVCIIEHLEHLCRRQIDGAELVRRLIRLMSRTDHRVQWIMTSANFGWQLIQTFETASSQLVTHHDLARIERKALEEMILERHRRSGLTLVFELPEDANPLLRRRYRLTRSDERRQELLRDAFFDRLYGRCGQNIMLAFFYWIRSVSTNADDSAVHVSEVRSLRFDFLDDLSLVHSFLLKSLLEHMTLTVEEYAHIGEMPVNMAKDLFESLANFSLIEEFSDDERASDSEPSAGKERRYRVRPLIVHPVIEHLRARNIIH